MNPPPGLRNSTIYLDYNATTPVDPRVAEAALPYLTEHFGNPSSGHGFGRSAKAALDTARAQVAALLGVEPEGIVFTSGGSEADTLAIRGAALARRPHGGHVITQITEHPAVLAACDSLERLHGYRITRLPVTAEGRVDPADLEAALTPETVLVSIMHANNETGTIQPIAELAAIAKARGVLFHTDASQSAGKIDIDIAGIGADLVTVTGHKLYAPKGIGALHVRSGIVLEPVIYGGGQEHGRRAGTENVALAVAFGEAARIAHETRREEAVRISALRDRLHQQLTDRLPGRVELNGRPTERLPNTLNVSIIGTRADEVQAGAPEIAAATGSACHEGTTTPSPVLTAMGATPERARAALRLTLGRWTTAEEIETAADALARATTIATA